MESSWLGFIQETEETTEHDLEKKFQDRQKSGRSSTPQQRLFRAIKTFLKMLVSIRLILADIHLNNN